MGSVARAECLGEGRAAGGEGQRERPERGHLGSGLCRPWRPLCDECSGRNGERLEGVSRAAQLLNASIKAVLWLIPKPGVVGDYKIYGTLVLFFENLTITLGRQHKTQLGIVCKLM